MKIVEKDGTEQKTFKVMKFIWNVTMVLFVIKFVTKLFVKFVREIS